MNKIILNLLKIYNHVRFTGKYKGNLISPFSSISGYQNTHLGKYNNIQSWSEINSNKGSIYIENKNYFHKNCSILTYGGNIKIGSNNSFNRYVILYGMGNLVIGDNCRIASHSVLVSANHIYENKKIAITSQGINKGKIIINSDVWIATRVTIGPNVEIGQGCVIGAHSFVNKNTEPYGVYVGTPARKIGERK